MQPIVRKKAAIAIIALEKLIPNSIDNFKELMEKLLKDSDICVVIAVLPFYLKMAQINPQDCLHLIETFLKIYDLLINRKISKDYDYENHSAPWATIKILQILHFLVAGNR